jgi:hypothetical protein
VRAKLAGFTLKIASIVNSSFNHLFTSIVAWSTRCSLCPADIGQYLVLMNQKPERKTRLLVSASIQTIENMRPRDSPNTIWV